jgi:hypothetical protein
LPPRRPLGRQRAQALLRLQRTHRGADRSFLAGITEKPARAIEIEGADEAPFEKLRDSDLLAEHESGAASGEETRE